MQTTSPSPDSRLGGETMDRQMKRLDAGNHATAATEGKETMIGQESWD